MILSAIIGALSVAATTIVKAFLVVMPPALKLAEVLKIIVNIAVHVMKAFNIVFGENENPEIVGDKILQAKESGIKPENFETYDEYREAIQNFKVDPEKSKMFTEEQRLEATLGYLAKLIEDKTGVSTYELTAIMTEMYKNNDYYSPERVSAIVNNFKTEGLDLTKLPDYFDRKLDIDDVTKVKDVLVKSAQEIDPAKSIEQIYSEIDSMKR